MLEGKKCEVREGDERQKQRSIQDEDVKYMCVRAKMRLRE